MPLNSGYNALNSAGLGLTEGFGDERGGTVSFVADADDEDLLRLPECERPPPGAAEEMVTGVFTGTRRTALSDARGSRQCEVGIWSSGSSKFLLEDSSSPE